MPRPKLIESTPKVVKDLATWIRQHRYLELDNGARFSRLVVYQVVKGNKRGEEVFYLDVPKKANDEWDDTTALEAFGKLQAEAATLGGLQKYGIYAYADSDNDRHLSRYVIRIQGADDDDEERGLDSEGVDRAGQVSQQMRHSEALMKINTSSHMTSVSALQGIIQQQNRMIEKLQEDHFKYLELTESMLSQNQERELERMKAEARAKAIQSMGEKIGLFIPAIANKLAGQHLFPVEANAVLMMARGLMTSIASNEEQMTKIMSTLSPEQAVAFMNLLETVSTKVDEKGQPIRNGTNGVNEAANPTT